METITQILSKYDTDKVVHHNYGGVYEELFSKFDRNAPLNILEIGTQKGGSLLAWKEFFPNANVYGVDIVDVVPEKYRKDTVTRIISDIKRWDNDIEWDIVIDDGSHFILDLAYVIAHYSIKLRVGGVLIIEDVRDIEVLYQVIGNILRDIRVGFPHLDFTGLGFDVAYFDKSTQERPESIIVAMKKKRT